jgi:hypothetical protein
MKSVDEKNSPLTDFGNEDGSSFLDEPIKTIVAFKDQLTPRQVQDLLPLLYLLPQQESEPIYGPDFDLVAEIDRMIVVTRAMQDSIMVNGRIKQSIPTREVKETTAAANTMLTSLMKHHKEVVNLARMQAAEKATVKVLKKWAERKNFLLL